MSIQSNFLLKCKNPLQGGIAPYVQKLLTAIVILVGIGLQSQAQALQLPQQRTPTTEQEKDDPVYTTVKQAAQFPGGVEEFRKFLDKNLQHTQEMISGRVILQFIVRKDGSLTDIKVLRGLSESNNAEAIRVIKLSPKWEPGEQDGNAVNMQYTVPIEFKSV